jgi:hypothetical protein
MLILAIDPGTEQSGWARLSANDSGRITVHDSGVMSNPELLLCVLCSQADLLAIEMIASYGMPVGQEVFQTCVWIGRFIQAWSDDCVLAAPDDVELIYRQQVKMHICLNSRAKDTNVRQALLDRLGPQGTKVNPGPTYGIKSHAWAALAVGVTAADKLLR